MTTRPGPLHAPFPYFGGKSRIAPFVWDVLGDVPNYVEPFFGSGATLLNRPDEHEWWDRTETVNDADGFVANFWRAVQYDPDAVARHADWPVSENDLHARHAWLNGQRAWLTPKLEGTADFYDAKIAGWWVWGMCLWIGSGFCSGQGPWIVDEDGNLVDNRQLVHLSGSGQGINRQRVHLSGSGQGINRKRVHLSGSGQGINRKLVHLSGGRGSARAWRGHIAAMMLALQDRLRRVRVCSGDWARVMGPTPTIKHGITGVFLDPPYADTADRTDNLYSIDSLRVAHDVREWAIEHGTDPRFRIVLAGYSGEHAMPANWGEWEWKAQGGYGSQGNARGRDNARKERLWTSPHCLEPDEGQLAA